MEFGHDDLCPSMDFNNKRIRYSVITLIIVSFKTTREKFHEWFFIRIYTLSRHFYSVVKL